MSAFKVTCPVCHEMLTFETDVAEFYGCIPLNDTGCVEVTRPWAPVVEEHLMAHRADGSMARAVEASKQKVEVKVSLDGQDIVRSLQLVKRRNGGGSLGLA